MGDLVVLKTALIQGVQSLALDFACSEDSASAVLK